MLAERFVFTSTSAKIDTNPPVLHASPSSELTINVYMINALGFKTPFSDANVRFEIEEGPNLVEIAREDPSKATIRSKGIEGEAIIGIYSLKSGALLQKILIKILAKDLAFRIHVHSLIDCV